jgi:predicted enzyme related to lactoylglutathione lyase
MTGLPIWYELMVPDIAAVRDFYRAVAGWEIPESGSPVGTGAIDYRGIQRGDGGMAGGAMQMSRDMIDHGAKPGWLAYFHVDDVAAAVARVESLGGKVHMPPRTIDVGTMAMVADPQGAPFYVMKPNPPAGRPDAQSDVFQPDTPGHCWWNELTTPDEPGATAFYTALLGWNADQAMPMGDKGNYRFIACEGRPIGAISPWMRDWMGVAWLPYFGVADIHAAFAAAQEHGGTVRGEIHEVPGGDLIFSATDPAGAPVAFVGKKEQ